MEEKQKNDSVFINLFKGALSGLLSMVPFLDSKRAREDVLVTYSFRTWSYILGFAIAFFVFSLLPISVMEKNFSYTVRLLEAGFLFGSLVVLLLLVFLDKKEKIDLLPFLLSLIGGIGIALIFYFAFTPAKLLRDEEPIAGAGFYSVIIAVGGFLCGYAGISIGSLLAVSGSYVGLIGVMYPAVSFTNTDKKSGILIMGILFLALFSGLFLGLYAEGKDSRKKNKEAMQIGFLLPMLVILIVYFAKNKPQAMADSVMVRKLVNSCSLIFSFLIALILGLSSLLPLWKEHPAFKIWKRKKDLVDGLLVKNVKEEKKEDEKENAKALDVDKLKKALEEEDK
ncbi:MAG: hypothetical protein WCR16_04245 [Bacilli bacterium]|jgi:MFS family permease